MFQLNGQEMGRVNRDKQSIAVSRDTGIGTEPRRLKGNHSSEPFL